jgi:ABC-2 type transport system ATP-binding protein
MFAIEEQETRRRVTELLEALELTGQGKKRLSEFSAGMRKRVAFAAAVIHKPEILILDEPFESIDPAGVAMLKEWLRHMVAEGRTVFMTTHVLETVERLCDRVGIIKDHGALIWEGDITPLATDQPLTVDGQEFHRLEDLYLRVSGAPYRGSLEWL